MWTYNNTYDSNELYHYGVKGMKWGVRKAQYKAMSRTQRRDQRKAYRAENGTFLRDKYGNSRKPSLPFAGVVGAATAMTTGMDKSAGAVRRAGDKKSLI